MHYRLLLFLFIFTFLSPGYSQLLVESEFNCNAQKILSAYQQNDGEAQINNPEVLFHMANLAQRVNNEKLALNYYHRIVDQKELISSSIFHRAQLELHTINNEMPVFDSLHRNMLRYFDKDDDIVLASSILQNIPTLRRPTQMRIDSTILDLTHRIKDKALYRGVISNGYQEVAKYLAANGRIKEGLNLAIQSMQFVNEQYHSCAPMRYNSYINVGRRYMDIEKPDSALFCFIEAHRHMKQYHPYSLYGLFQSSFNISNAYEAIYDYERAQNYLDSSEYYLILDTSRNIHLNLSSVYNEKAGLYNKVGKLEKSKVYFLQSIEQADLHSDKATIQRIASYTNVASQLSALGDFDNAKEFLERALSYCGDLLGKNHRFAGIILMKLGQVHYDMEEYDKCESYFNQSLTIRKLNAGEGHTSLANIYSNFAILHRDQSNYEKAIVFLDSALSIYSNNFGDHHPTVASTYNRRARINLMQKHYTAAASDVRKCMQSLDCKDDFRMCDLPFVYMDLVEKRSQLLTREFLAGNEVLDSLLSLCMHGDSAFTYLFQRAESIGDKSEMAANYTSFYKRYIHALLLRYNQKKDTLDIEKAYVINNKMKNLGLLHALQEQSQYMFSSVPFSIRQERKSLLSQIKKIELQIFNSVEVSGKTKNENQRLLNSVRKKLQFLDATIATDYPLFSRLQHNQHEYKLSEIQSKLGSHEVVLDFALVDSVLITFTVSSATLDANLSYVHADSLQSQSSRWLDQLANNEVDYGKDMEFDILTEVVKNLSGDVTDLIIIADGFLSSIPFEILKLENSILLDQFNVRYANSVYILAHQKRNRLVKNNVSVSIFTPSYTSNQSSKPNEESPRATTIPGILPYSQEEASFIQSLWNGEIYEGEYVTKQNLIKALGESSIIHFSMHAEANDEQPMHSCFFLSTGDSSEDKKLYLYELYDFESTAELAVLSACETGVGEFHQGAGVRSLANGFQYAGIPSVVLSLWKVPDESTSLIMKSFYGYLKDGNKKHVALRLAKRHYLENCVSEKLRHPFYWAGFILVGDESPIASAPKPFPILYILIGIISLAVLYFFNKILS